MDNVLPEGNQYQTVTYQSGEDLGEDAPKRNTKCNKKVKQRILNWSVREWNYTAVT